MWPFAGKGYYIKDGEMKSARQVDNSEKEPDISEPVNLIIEAMEKRPETFEWGEQEFEVEDVIHSSPARAAGFLVLQGAKTQLQGWKLKQNFLYMVNINTVCFKQECL